MIKTTQKHQVTVQFRNLTYATAIPILRQLSKGGKAMTDEPDPARLKALEKRIAKAKAVHAPKPHQEQHYSQANLAWRMVIELVAGLGIGFGIGYGLDILFGTLPIFLVLFIFAGLAAGIRTMLRSAKEVQARQMAEKGDDTRGG
jgi:ATP synthase protein I